MPAGPRMLMAAGLAVAGLGLVGAGAGATFTAQVSGTLTVATGRVGLSINGQTGSDLHLDLEGQGLGTHFAPMTQDLRLKNIGNLDLPHTFLALSSPQCARGTGDGDDDQGEDDDNQGDQDGQGNGQGNRQGNGQGNGNGNGNHNQKGSGDSDDAGALAQALHATVTDETHHLAVYDGALCAFAPANRLLPRPLAAGETTDYHLVLSPEGTHGLPVAALQQQATIRVTFSGTDS